MIPEETRELSRWGRRSVFYNNINPMHEDSILLTKSSPKGPHLLRTSHWALKFQHTKFGGGHKLSDHGKSRAPIIHVKSSVCVPFVFYAALFPSILLSFISSQQHLSVSTIKKDSKYYRKSLQYAWSFTLLPKNGEMKIFSSMFHKWTSKTASKKKKLRLVNYSSILRRELEIQLYLQYHPGKSY